MDERIARAALSIIIEPSDGFAHSHVRAVGAEALLLAIHSDKPPTGVDPETFAEWVARSGEATPEKVAQTLADEASAGGGFLIPGDRDYPQSLGGTDVVFGLWFRGDAQGLGRRSIAVIGAKDSTDYGNQVARGMAVQLTTMGYTVAATTAHGIAAVAATAALGEAGRPVLVTASGLDSIHPAGNATLHQKVMANGTIVSISAPGRAVNRPRMLAANLVLATITQATLVVEARTDSAAVTTAIMAEAAGRPVGAVPGSVFSATSGGTHYLVNSGTAKLVTGAAEMAMLLGDYDFGVRDTGDEPVELDVMDRMVLDCLGYHSGRTHEQIAATAGLGSGAVLGGLARLGKLGLVERVGDGWLRTRR